MKKIIYIACAAAALAAVSCAKTAEFDSVKPDRSGEGLTLRFTTGDMTRATTVDGVDNENLIKKIDYFIFPYNVDDEGNMVGTTEYVYKGTVTPEDDGLAGSYEETFAPGILSEIFPDGATKAVVFAVANYVDKFGAAVESPNTTIPETAKTWEALHALEVGETFFKDGGPGYELRWPRVMQPSPYTVTSEGEGGEEVEETVTDDLFFVMTGEEEIELSASGSYAVDAEIPLKRLASKVTVDFDYETVVEEKTSGNIYWVPQPSGEETRVFLSNAIEHTTLGGPLTRDLVADSWATCTKPQPGGDGTRDIFEYSYDYMNDIAPDENGDVIAHYYTYPIQMNAGDDNQTYLKLVLPWYGYKWIGGGDAPQTVNPSNAGWQMYKQKEVYYKIVLPASSINEGNRIYEFSVTVNIVGSDKEVKIIGEEYKVKDWLTKDPVSSNVATGRYISLDIPKDEYDMYVNEIDIAFVSSGTVTPIVEEIYQWNYSSETSTKDYFMQDDHVTTDAALLTRKGFTAADVEGWVSIPEESSYLKINHVLCNDIHADPITKYDATPYVYVVRLHLEAAGDDTSFDRTVTITQYPSMYITARLNTDYDDDGESNYNNHRGYAWVNNSYTQWGNVNGMNGSAQNANPNMYLITTSVLPKDSNDRIGDPRSDQVYMSNNTQWVTAPSVDGSNRRLLYHYPTETSGTANTIAPSFRIASSYGVTSGISKTNATNRCASYQEDGYPAGRWRIPTRAEIAYIASLSSSGFIPVLFNPGGTYWSATTAITVAASGGTISNSPANSAYVRCVYDEWYWGPERLSDITVFTWGDKQR